MMHDVREPTVSNMNAEGESLAWMHIEVTQPQLCGWRRVSTPSPFGRSLRDASDSVAQQVLCPDLYADEDISLSVHLPQRSADETQNHLPAGTPHTERSPMPSGRAKRQPLIQSEVDNETCNDTRVLSITTVVLRS